MNESEGYAVFFFPQALEALGDAIKPYLQDGPGGEHVLCREIDTGGALIELTLAGTSPDGRELELELMVPTAMVRMIVSARSDPLFGFGPRMTMPITTTAPAAAEAIESLPPVGPTAAPVEAPPAALPVSKAATAEPVKGAAAIAPASESPATAEASLAQAAPAQAPAKP